MQNLFVYGTIKDSEVQKKVIGRVAESQNDSLEGYSKSSIILKGITYSILVKGVEEIEGVVLQVTEEELKKFDIFETKAYRRVREKLKSGIESWVYVK